MYSKESDLLKQIAESRESIRQKHLQLKTGLLNIQTDVSKVFQPIIKPLNEIVSRGKEKKEPLNEIASKEKKKERVSFHSSTPHKSYTKNTSFSDVGDDEDEVVEESSAFKTVTQNNDSNNNFDEKLTENAQTYLEQVENRGFNIDRIFGVRKVYGNYMIGDQIIDFSDGQVIVGGEKYPETEGLLALLFKRRVDDELITKNDVMFYEKIVKDTNLLRKNFNPNGSFKNPTFHTKFDTYLRHLNPSNQLKNTSGTGLPKFMIARRNEPSLDYKYWDDPNELVDRLRLLIAERSAGNNNHDNEIHAIIEELREAKIIY